jgi:SAM-dependent methyltransferase
VSGSDAAGAAACSPGRGAKPSLAGLLDQWREDLASWAIPADILAAVPDSPWVLPGQVFARRADKLSVAPSGPSFERAWAALDPPGSVLDVGSGPGAACLPLLPRSTALTAVDAEEPMLAMLAERAIARGVRAQCVVGRWPQVASFVPAADVVTCHHVIYNVPDLEPFLLALTDHAARLVVVETAALHPLTSLNDLWLRFHDLRRPGRPSADDFLAILAAMGVRAGHQSWRRPGGADYASFDELTDVTRRRLCLPVQRADEVAQALIEAGVDPADPRDLGSSGRDVMTIWWAGRATK